MTLVSQMRGAPSTHVVRMRTAPNVGPKPLLLRRHWVTAGLAVGLRACVLPTGKFPPLAPLGKIPPLISPSNKRRYTQQQNAGNL